MYEVRHCSYSIAKKLKERGFDAPCDSCYYTLVTDKEGNPLSFDEELDLKGEGREDEICYIKGGAIWDHYTCNKEEKGSDVCARPTQDLMIQWFLLKYKVFIYPKIYYCEDGLRWLYRIDKVGEYNTEKIKEHTGYDNMFDAIDGGIEWCVDNIF